MSTLENIPEGLQDELRYLAELFRPENFREYETDFAKRDALTARFITTGIMLTKTIDFGAAPELSGLKERVDGLSAVECAKYLVRYLRLSVSQGDGESFTSLWKDGTARKLALRFLETLEPVEEKTAQAQAASPVGESGKAPASEAPEFLRDEKMLLMELIMEHMGDRAAEKGWNVSFNSSGRRVHWSSGWGVDGFNYCAEDEVGVYLIFTPGGDELCVEGFERLGDPARLLSERGHCRDRLFALVKALMPRARAVWIKDKGHYHDPEDDRTYFNADVELFFEGLSSTGRNIRLQYSDVTISPF